MMHTMTVWLYLWGLYRRGVSLTAGNEPYEGKCRV